MAEINWKDKCWMTVIYLVREDGKVLLHWNKNMNTWIPIGGHIEPGETPREAIKREIKEETEFEFNFLKDSEVSGNSEIIDIYRFQIDTVPHHNYHMTFVFVGKCNKYFEKQGTDKNEELKWFSKEEILEIKDKMIESVWKVALEAIELVTNKQPEKTEIEKQEEKPQPKVGIGIMLIKGGKVLLGKRHENPEKASSLLKGEGTWTMPGGKLHFQESFEEGAKRELFEETSINLKRAKIICVNNDTVEDAHFITIGLFAEHDDFEGIPEVKEPDEITEWKWFSLDNLPLPIYFPSAKVLENYKKNKFYIKNRE